MYFGRLRRQAALLRCGRKRRDSAAVAVSFGVRLFQRRNVVLRCVGHCRKQSGHCFVRIIAQCVAGLTQKCLCFQLGFLRFERCSVGSQPFGLGLLFPRGFLLGLFGRFGCAFGKRLADAFVDFGLLLGRKNGLVVPRRVFRPLVKSTWLKCYHLFQPLNVWMYTVLRKFLQFPDHDMIGNFQIRIISPCVIYSGSRQNSLACLYILQFQRIDFCN